MSWNVFKNTFQRSPIIFTGGIASQIPGDLMSINVITGSQNFNQGASPGVLNDDTALFDFHPLAGSNLAEFQVGQYPFANQAVAGNAIIAEPLKISMMMRAPVRAGNGGYGQRLAAFQALQAAIASHASAGGTYTVCTPSYIYTSCILVSLRDASQGDPAKPQDAWIWDFIQPLLTADALGGAYSSLLKAIGSGVSVTPPGGDPTQAISWSGLSVGVGNQSSGMGGLTTPGLSSVIGSLASGPSTLSYAAPSLIPGS